MAELTSPLEELAAQDLDALCEPQLLGRIRELVAAQNRLAAELARTVRAAETAQACAHDGSRR